jgi:ABC-type sugar transport system ATPase subunit
MEVLLKAVRKKFGVVPALDGVDAEFPHQTFTCIYGPPGAGKSTLLRIVAGLEVPDSGEVFIGRKDMTFAPPKERNVSYIAQEFALYPHMSVFQNIAYPLRLRKYPEAKIREKVLQVARFLKIDKLLDRKPAQLSGGEQQRVAIARGLVKESSIYVFDEPLTNLDYKIREDMRGEFRRFQREFGQTIIYATGDPVEALSLSERIIILNGGKVVESGDTRQVYRQPANLFTMMHFGFPQANVVPGEIISGGIFSCPLFSVKCALVGIPRDKKAVCTFRPEDIALVGEDFRGVVFVGRVFVVDVIGSESVIYVRVGENGEIVRILAERNCRPGLDENVKMGIQPEKMLFYSSLDGSFLGKGGS